MRGKRLSSHSQAALAILTIVLFAASACAAQQETVLHSFGNGSDGGGPSGGLIIDAAGNLYGITYYGGIHGGCHSGCGTAFELSPRAGGAWTETVMHSFGGGSDGKSPSSVLLMDSAGNLYGTTYAGGIHRCGTVFEIVR